METKNGLSRRSFLKSGAMAGALGAIGTGTGATTLLSSCSGQEEKKTAYTPLRPQSEIYIPYLTDKAIDGKPLKAGIIGCGGRGSGAAFNFLDAADNVTITALADVFQERVDGLRNTLKEKRNIDIPAENCFVGFDAYQKVIDAGVDVVLICTPPVFRPEQFKYAVEKNKHSFLEKPVAADAAGYRQVVASSKQAVAKGLCVITGTQRHHQRCYVASYQKVQEGLLGEITGGVVYWNQSMLWYRNREKNWTDVEWMIKDWVNWTWLSGDHIVEQHVHNIDVYNWFTGQKPTSAVAFGSRQRRITGNQYDNFSTDFVYPGGVHMHSMCRQIDGCVNNVSEFIQGTLGSWDSKTFEIKDLQGNVVWKYDFEQQDKEFKQNDPYVLEHVDWITHIRKNEPFSEAEDTAISTLCAVMGRVSAYTGSEVTWDAMSAADQNLLPADLSLATKMPESTYVIPVPGSTK